MMLMMLPLAPSGNGAWRTLRQNQARADWSRYDRPRSCGCALPIVILEQRGGIDQRGQRTQFLDRAVHQGGGSVSFDKSFLRSSLGAEASPPGRAVGIVFRTVVMDCDIPALRRQVRAMARPSRLAAPVTRTFSTSANHTGIGAHLAPEHPIRPAGIDQDTGSRNRVPRPGKSGVMVRTPPATGHSGAARSWGTG
jgi:hypothetical protein